MVIVKPGLLKCWMCSFLIRQSRRGHSFHITELPKEFALEIDPESRSGKVYTNAERKAAHREAVLRRKEEKRLANAVPVVKQRQRIGRRPEKLGKSRYRCYYVDPKTKEQCNATYSTIDSLQYMHFRTKHPGSQ